MLGLLKNLHHWRGKFDSRAFDRAAAEPETAQREFLLRLLQKNAASRFGKLHNFARLKTENDFRRQIPVRDYEDFRPFIAQIAAGERSILTLENPFMLTLTSGTTSEPKLIPITREAQNINAGLMRQWLYRAAENHPNLTAQASVGIVSRATEGATVAGLPFGSASGLIYKNIPALIRRAYAVPYAAAEIADYDERYFAVARFALGSRVSFIATPNPNTLLRLAQVCVENQENLIRAVHDGTLGIANPKQSQLFDNLARRLKPNPARAKLLSEAAARRGFLRLKDCWADLKLLGCWTGGSVGAQIEKLNRHFGGVAVRDLGYLASEGHFTVPISDSTAAGVLAVKNNYFEFVPEAEIDWAQPTIVSVGELETGKRYEILLTTAAGLYRYRIGDIVEVQGFYRRAPLVAFVRKAGEMANIAGEKMHANHIAAAVAVVSRRFDLQIEQFRAAPDCSRNRYEIYLELAGNAPPEKMGNEILLALDRELARANCEYEQKRRSKRLAAPVLKLMKRGWAEHELRRHVAAGKRDTQFKWRVLSAEKSDADAAFVRRTIESAMTDSVKAF